MILNYFIYVGSIPGYLGLKYRYGLGWCAPPFVPLEFAKGRPVQFVPPCMSDSHLETWHYPQVLGEHEDSVDQSNLTVQMFMNFLACIYAFYIFFWVIGAKLKGDAKCLAMYRSSFVLFRPMSLNMFWLLTVRHTRH